MYGHTQIKGKVTLESSSMIDTAYKEYNSCIKLIYESYNGIKYVSGVPSSQGVTSRVRDGVRALSVLSFVVDWKMDSAAATCKNIPRILINRATNIPETRITRIIRRPVFGGNNLKNQEESREYRRMASSNVRECIYSLDGVKDEEYTNVFADFLKEKYAQEIEDMILAVDDTQVRKKKKDPRRRTTSHRQPNFPARTTALSLSLMHTLTPISYSVPLRFVTLYSIMA